MTTSTENWPAGRILALIGLILYGAIGLFPYASSGLLAPVWGIAVLYAGWLLGLWLTIRLFRLRSAWALAMPGAALAWWWLVLAVGESVFGWTA